MYWTCVCIIYVSNVLPQKYLKENNYFGDNLNDLNTQTINTKHDNFGEQEKIENIKEIENVIKEIDDKDSDINSFMNAFDEENNKESEEFLKSDVNVKSYFSM